MDGGLRQIAGLLVLTGILLAGIGLLLLGISRIQFLGRLPGDIVYETKHTRVFFPIVTCLVLSVLLTLILNLIALFFRK